MESKENMENENKRIYDKLKEILTAKDIYIGRNPHNSMIEISSCNKNQLHKLRREVGSGHVVQSDCERYIFEVNIRDFKLSLGI